jgi:rRNA-processing protein FCF1
LEYNKNIHDLIFDGAQKSRIEKTDDFLIKKCEDLKQENDRVFLATNDQDLRRKARERGISTIFLRQKKYICVEGP